MAEMIDHIGDAGYLAGAVGAVLFVVLYLILARFWESEAGWHIFSFMTTVAMILIHSSIGVYFPNYPGRDVVRAILYPVLAAIIFWRVVILVRVQLLSQLRASRRPPDGDRVAEEAR